VFLIPQTTAPNAPAAPGPGAPATSPYGNWLTGEPLSATDAANLGPLTTIATAMQSQGKGTPTLAAANAALTGVRGYYASNPAQYVRDLRQQYLSQGGV
jgi:hypothetical protein